jgi:hypothetical protein
MDWQTRHAGLTPEQAKARLLALVEESSAPSVIARHPWYALAIALAGGFFLARTARFWCRVGSGGMCLVQQIVPLLLAPRNTALDDLKARARRMD